MTPFSSRMAHADGRVANITRTRRRRASFTVHPSVVASPAAIAGGTRPFNRVIGIEAANA